jgi:hypothetical protein
VVTKEEALKLALEALECTLPVIQDFGDKEKISKQYKALASLYEVLALMPPAAQPAQPAQEPLFLLHTGDIDSNGEQGDWESETDSGVRVDEFCAQHPNKTFGLYTTPPQRPWVGLDEQDFSAIYQSCLTKLQAATSAESVLKEKNT